MAWQFGCPGPHVPLDSGSSDGPDIVAITDIAVDAASEPASDIVVDAGRDETTPVTDTNDDVDTGVSDATNDAATDASPDALPDARTDTVAMDAALDGMDAALDGVADGDSGVPEAGPWVPFADGGCDARVRATPIQPALHVDFDSGPIDWWTDPPSSGPHYGIWARWGDNGHIPPGYWVHNLEHSGIMLLYRCPSGTCTALRTSLVGAMNSIPMDPACMPTDAEPARVRVIVTDYPLSTEVAAVAWGWLYAADCVDPPSIRAFYAAHQGMGPEDFCADGFYP